MSDVSACRKSLLALFGKIDLKERLDGKTGKMRDAGQRAVKIQMNTTSYREDSADEANSTSLSTLKKLESTPKN